MALPPNSQTGPLHPSRSHFQSPLVAFHDQVTFLWNDYAHGNKKKMMTLSSQEFLRRFLLHVLNLYATRNIKRRRS